MEQIIKDIQNVFTQFDNFNFVIDTESKKVLDFDFEEMNLLFYDEVKKIEQLLQSIYLQGNDKTLQRVKLELLRIENTLKNIDFGVVIHYSKYSFNITIEPEIVTKINLLKLNYINKIITFIENILPPQQTERKTELEQPKTFEELFYNPKHAEPCLKILSELQPPVIDAINNYIGKTKGVFPLWVKVLKNYKPEPLIKHFKDTVYKDLLNKKINGLKLSNDASEFRKQYVRLEKEKTELEIKVLLSQYSQSGKLGK